jgi:hypothetical protein
MNDHRDLLETLRDELDVMPSPSFEPRVRVRVEHERRPALAGRRLAGPIAVATLGACVTVWGIAANRAGTGLAPVGAPAPATDVSDEAFTSSRFATEPAAIANPKVEARSTEAAVVPPRDTRASRLAANANANGVRRDPPSVFRPFEDVVISPREQRGLLLLMRYGDADALPPSPALLTVDEPVRVVALNKLPPIELIPVDGPVRTEPVSDSSR